jgi:choline dehydrogenase-like flavoprotein
MTSTVTVVGSGASGVHFALSLLRKGISVTMLDVGRQGPAPVSPASNLPQLKDTLADPSAYFLGKRFESVLLPDARDEYYGIPPNKQYVFDPVDGFRHASAGFSPLFSFARGGFAEAWTGGCYPLNDHELSDFPFAFRDIALHYDEIARRIGITGADDDLAKFVPVHDHLMPALRLDAHSAKLLRRYERARGRLNRSGAYLGRTRVATLSRALGAREPCNYLGRCLWGCPRKSLYTPSQTLQECEGYANFKYIPGIAVERFIVGAGNRVRSLIVRRVDGGSDEEFAVDRLALAAGTLSSTRIFLTSVLRQTGERVRLHGLMDNRQVFVPFVNPAMFGETFSSDTYQYHLVGMGIEAKTPRDYVHGQITTLKTALLHPIIQKLPFDLSTSTYIVRALHAALGVVNVNFRDTRREESYVELCDDDTARLRIHYRADSDELGRVSDALRKVNKLLFGLRCLVPPGMTYVRPMGASVHYAGTLPMAESGGQLTTTPSCESRDFSNLFLVDGSTFPFLPAKNITFTLMANAARVADMAF